MNPHADPVKVYEALARILELRENVRIRVTVRPKPPDADGEPPGERRPEEASA